MQAKNLSEVFRDAQKHLWDGTYNKPGCEFICHAISTVDTDYALEYTARSVVRVAIYPEETFDNWLQSQGVHYTELNDDKRVQAHRLQWLKMLETQFKGE